MKNLIKVLIPVLFLLISCNKKQNLSKTTKPIFQFEKVIVVNLNEVCLTYFKIKVINENQNSIIILDNSLKKYQSKRLNPEKTGFYLKNVNNDSIITLGIDNYNFYEVGPKTNDYLFIGATNMKNSFKEKDSILFTKSLSNFLLEYNGKKLDLKSIEKSNYINQNAFDEFTKRKNTFIPFKDSLSITIPKNIKIKYCNNLPTNREEWNKF
jgi:hypothetical protein